MSYSMKKAARRGGVDVESVARYAGVGLIDVEDTGEFSDEDIRKIQVFQTLEQAGLPIEGVAALVKTGRLSLGFIEAAGQYVFVPFSDCTFAEVSESTAISMETLAGIRESLEGSHLTLTTSWAKRSSTSLPWSNSRGRWVFALTPSSKRFASMERA